MYQPAARNPIAERLQRDILSLQGFRNAPEGQRTNFGLGPVEASFPNKTFPTGAVHEFLSTTLEDSAATIGFMGGLLSRLLKGGGACLWISMNRTVFPPALKIFGMEPDRIIFIDLHKKEDVLWAVEEALKCDALTAVVGELSEITLTQSRRLQLAVEQSRVTGFLHRSNPRSSNTLACVSRWKITPVASELEEGMPGVGFPKWNVQLLKVRNGEPGEWQIQWSAGGFQHFVKPGHQKADPRLLKTG